MGGNSLPNGSQTLLTMSWVRKLSYLVVIRLITAIRILLHDGLQVVGVCGFVERREGNFFPAATLVENGFLPDFLPNSITRVEELEFPFALVAARILHAAYGRDAHSLEAIQQVLLVNVGCRFGTVQALELHPPRIGKTVGSQHRGVHYHLAWRECSTDVLVTSRGGGHLRRGRRYAGERQRG